MMPKGKLLIIGGAEDVGDDDMPDMQDRQHRFEILSELLRVSKNKKIEIVTTASKVPEEVRKRYQVAFHKMGYPDPGFMPIKNKFEAREEDYLVRTEKAGAIFFTGGDQFRLSTILGGTPIVDIIKDRYKHEKNFVVAGTSAGAMVMSAVMITEGGLEEALIYRNITTTSGLGFLQDCIIDTHFIKRGRFGRLAHAVIVNPDQLGIGLGEDTALIINKGYEAECRGSGMVVIIDGKEIGQTNITNATEEDAIFVENLRVHILVKGCRFSINTRQLHNPAISPQFKFPKKSKKLKSS